MIFEEALLKTDTLRKKLSIEDVTFLRQNDLQKFSEIKENLFCPECEKPHLTYKLCVDKASYFATHIGQEHSDECSFKCEKATSKQLDALADDETSFDKLQNRLKAALVLLFSSKKTKYNPLVIKGQDIDNESRISTSSQSVSQNYAIPKKRITNGLSESDVDALKIFYGKVRIRCKRYRNGYRLYVLNCFDDQSPIICSIYLSQKVFDHIDINVGDYFKCLIAFFAKLEINKYNGQTFYNCILTDSRKMAFIKIVN